MADEWGEEFFGDLTDNFDSVRVPVKQSERRAGPYPYYGASGIVDHVDDYLFDGQHLLIAEDGENLRTRQTPIAFLANGKFWVNNHAHIVRGNHKANTRFLMYALSQVDISGYLTGSTMPKLTQGNLNRISLRTPHLSEQCAISHILGTFDEKIELNRRMNETLEAMARTLFQSWFVDFDPVQVKVKSQEAELPLHLAQLFPSELEYTDEGRIPRGWKLGTLHDLAHLNPESWTARRRPGEVSYVDLSNAKRGDISNVASFPWEEAPSRARRVLRRGDTILGTVRPGNRSFALIDEDGLTGSTGFAVLRPQTEIHREYIWCATTSPENIERLAHLADGGAYPAVRPDAVLETKAALATPEVHEAFSRIVAPMLSKAAANRREMGYLSDLRDALLSRLISGRLRTESCKESSKEKPCDT